MKNKTMVITYFLLLTFSILSIANAQQGLDPNILVNERANEKATFDYHQGIYNDKANKQLRAKAVVAKERKTDRQENKEIEETQDKTKGQILVKF